METTSLEPGGKTEIPAFSKLAVLRRAFWLSLLSFSPALLTAILWVFLRSPETAASATAAAATKPDLSFKFMYEVALGPFIETTIFQLFVIELLLRVGLRRASYIVFIAAIIFISVHFTNPYGTASGISVIPGGFVLAYSYLYWRQKTGSWRVASTATWLTHGLHNFYFWLLNFVPASLIFG